MAEERPRSRSRPGGNGAGAEAAPLHHHHHLHQHIHERSVHVQGNAGIIVTGDRCSGTMVATLNVNEEQEKQQCDIARKLDDWIQGMVDTCAFKRVMEMLNKGTTWITIKGSPGEGKTTVAKMALREMQKSGRQVFQVRSPKEFTKITKTYCQPVILLDDILGDLEFDQTAWQKWRPIFHQVLDEKDHRSHEQNNKILQKKDLTVILVGRDYVLNSASVPMGRLFDIITRKTFVVDMSHSVQRPLAEKMAIWKSIVGPSGISVLSELVPHILKFDGQHGFPHVCRLFVTLHKENPNISVEKFFKTPLTFLNETVKIFLENKFKLLLFKEMIAKQGKVSERDLQETGLEVTKTAKELLGTYLRIEDGYFVFHHPSVYDSVAFILCTYHTLFVIGNCKLSFIHERLRLEPSHDKENTSLKTETDLVMFISKHFIGDLAKRFAEEVSARHLLLVLSHQACTQDVFIKEMMTKLQIPLTELVNMTDSESDENFFSLLASNKSAKLFMYIDNHTDIQLSQSDINNVLYGVCKFAASDVLSYLKQTRHTVDLNVKYGNEVTPLMLASETRDSQFVLQILSLNPDLNACDRYRKTALHYMCRNGLVTAVKEMIDRGSDVNVKDRQKWSPLLYACRSGEVEIVRLLLDRGAEIDGDSVVMACYKEDLPIVTMLFEKGANVNMESSLNGTPLTTACAKGDMELIRYLFDKGASVNKSYEGKFPLHWATSSKNPEIFKFLLEHGADIESRDNMQSTALHSAARGGAVECVEVLLNAGASLIVQNEFGDTPLHSAAWEKLNSECIEKLIKAGADIDAKNNSDYTPLYKAAEWGAAGSIETLLTAGADVNIQSRDGQNPLHAALDCRRHDIALPPDVSICQKLIDHGTDLNKQDRDGNTPLHLLCRINSDTPLYKEMSSQHSQPALSYEDIFKTVLALLVDHGADVNVCNRNGVPALNGWCQTLITIRRA